MRIHLASHLFTPRPQGIFCSDLATHWAGQGHEVVVFTADSGVAGPHAGYRLVPDLPLAYNRASLPHRLGSRLAFGAAAAWRSAQDARVNGRPDVFVSAGVLPGVWRSIASRRQQTAPDGGTRLVVWIFDLWPDVLRAHRPDSTAIRLGTPALSGALAQILKRADAVVTISNGMGDIIASRAQGAPVQTIPLWAPDEPGAPAPVAHHLPRPSQPDQPDQPDQAHTRISPEPLLAAYHGNLGLSYDFEPILGGARRFRSDQVRFLIVGEGPRREEIRRRIEADRLDNVELRSPLPSAAFWTSLAQTDVHLLPVRDSWDVVSFPSKVLAYLAAGRPILVLGGLGGETATMVRASGCGVTAPATADGLEAALRPLLSDQAGRARMGGAGRRLYEERFSASRAFIAWDQLLARLAPGRSRQ